MSRQILVIRTTAILVSVFATLGASFFVASPWSEAAAYKAKLDRMRAEQPLSASEDAEQLSYYVPTAERL